MNITPGATLTGKTQLLLKLLKYRHLAFDVKFDTIYYAAPQETFHGAESLTDQLKDVCPEAKILTEFPDFDALGLGDNPHRHTLIIIGAVVFIDYTNSLVL